MGRRKHVVVPLLKGGMRVTLQSTQHAGKTWQTLLEHGQAPVWLPKKVGAAFAHAHLDGAAYAALPTSVLVDATDETIRLTEVTDPGQPLTPPEDLALCIARLLSLALTQAERMRHAFQQLALLWRTYRDCRNIGTLSAMEEEIVSLVVRHVMWPGGLGEGLAATVDKQMAAGRVPTLHDLIDVLFYYVRDAQYRGRGT